MMENVNEFVTSTVMENVIEDVAEEAVKSATKGLGKGAKMTIGGVIVTVIVGGLILGYNKIKKHKKTKQDDNVIDAEHEVIEEEVIEEEN